MAGIRNALKMDVDCSAVGSPLLLLSNYEQKQSNQVKNSHLEPETSWQLIN